MNSEILFLMMMVNQKSTTSLFCKTLKIRQWNNYENVKQAVWFRAETKLSG